MPVLQRPAMKSHWPSFTPTSTAPEAPHPALRAPTITTPAKHKTELCKLYMRTRICPYGAGCQFAHGHHELKLKQHSRAFKTQLCRNFWELNCQCRYAANDRCQYIHDEPERVAAVLLSHAPATMPTSLRFPSPHAVDQYNASHNLNGAVAWFVNNNLGFNPRHVSEEQLRFEVSELLARQSFGAGAAPPYPPGLTTSPRARLPSPLASPRLAHSVPPPPSPRPGPLPLLVRPAPIVPPPPSRPFPTHLAVPPLAVRYLNSKCVTPYSTAADYTFTTGALSASLYTSSQSSTSDPGSGGWPSPLGSPSSVASVLGSPARVPARVLLQCALSRADPLAAAATPLLSVKDVAERAALWVLNN